MSRIKIIPINWKLIKLKIAYLQKHIFLFVTLYKNFLNLFFFKEGFLKLNNKV